MGNLQMSCWASCLRHAFVLSASSLHIYAQKQRGYLKWWTMLFSDPEHAIASIDALERGWRREIVVADPFCGKFLRLCPIMPNFS
jgi:hypothetical protein